MKVPAIVKIQISIADILIRRNLTGRWVAAVIWLIALASYFMAMHWEDADFLNPAIFLYAAEVLILLAKDLMRTIRDDGNERFIKDEQYLFFFTGLRQSTVKEWGGHVE